MTKEEGLSLLTKIIKDDIKHPDYKRVTELADLYFKMVTGEGIEELLQQIVTRESDAEFEQRKRITRSIIPPTLSAVRLPFQKATRKRPTKRLIDWPKGDVEKMRSELEEHISNFWGDSSLERYLSFAFVNYNFIDPNAFLITEFAPFDPLKEKARPYPFVATSHEAIMYDFHNNNLNYLVVELPVTYILDGKEANGHKYTMYLGEDTIQLVQVGKRGDGEYVTINEKVFEIQYFQPLAVKVPARRIGYRQDMVTSGRTFVSVFHDVIPYLEKTLKIDSELDLSTAMTAFPQRLAYVSPCPNCNTGRMPDGSECPACHGTGKEPLHSSVMDVVTLNIPRDPKDIIDLEKLLAYKSPPVELLKFQEEYLAGLKASVYLMIFNKEQITRNELVSTATEVNVTEDNVNDTLYPFATALSMMWESVVKDIATFTDLNKGKDIILSHIFPENFKFKSKDELISQLKAAKDAGAQASTIKGIEGDLNEMLYADRPDDLKAIKVKQSFNPFDGYSEEDVRLLISQGLTTKRNAVLWANLESIFADLERENEVWIYDLDQRAIIEKLNAKVDEYIQQLEEKEPEMPSFV